MEAFPTRVRKRDGREESFDAVRLAASIQTALSSVNAEIGISTQLAEEVSGSTFGSATVETSELSALVETTLAEHDLQTAADAYRDFRQQAQHALQRVRIHTARGNEETSRPWDRRRLVVALMRDRHLESGLAGQVARRVERRVLGARLRHLTGRLVGTLADNECRTLGLRGDSLDAERVGLERRHLSAWLGGDCLPASDGSPSMAAPGQDPRPALGGQILARFAGQEILTASQAQGMADGLFELPTLGDWTRPARLLLRPSIGEDENAFWRRVSDELGRAHEVQVHWPAGRDWTAQTLVIPRWVARPDSRLRLFTDDSALALEWAKHGRWVRLFLDGFLMARPEHRRQLGETGRVFLAWAPDRSPLRRARGVESLESSAVINLAGAARSTSNVAEFFERVGDAADLACSAAKLLVDRAGHTAGPRICLQPAGLSQALEKFSPSQDKEDAESIRILLALRERFRTAARQVGFRCSFFAPPHPEGSGAQLAMCDHAVESGTYQVGWSPVETGPAPPASAFRSAPWLEFASGPGHQTENLQRWSTLQSPPSS